MADLDFVFKKQKAFLRESRCKYKLDKGREIFENYKEQKYEW